MRTLFALLFTLAALTACGYKGPLYLPAQTDAKPAAAKPAPATASQPKADASGVK
ncbi:LPS translocon maturation chaperone LptM [Paludibacterium paludis]|uniref:Lipoprotein n=1 Tax=Paludibacterium paludis TaxID=1225769 RepID=A0A918U999_9NEIS|nr:lipoprotein [Paludibacterium paludis]GGY12352.1 hypothetical protein GCM10011289_14360 [Paludibacterium paludis]